MRSIEGCAERAEIAGHAVKSMKGKKRIAGLAHNTIYPVGTSYTD